MLKNLKLLITLTISSVVLVNLAQEVNAQTALNQATVESLRNQVRIIPQRQNARPARISDILRLGDAIATAPSSTVDLRFNDRSLARLGEQAIFRFNAGTRTVDLANGTGLFLINPGQGTTTIRTPNAAAGIRGSALFARVIPAIADGQEAITLIGALTDSGIQVCNQDSSQCFALAEGNMAFFEGKELAGVYKFDLDTFLQTSSLTQDLEEVAPELVLKEISDALKAQTPLNGAILNTPDFIKMPDVENAQLPDPNTQVVGFSFPQEFVNQNQILEPTNLNSIASQELVEVSEMRLNTPINNISSSQEVMGVGEMRLNTPINNTTGGNFPGGGATGGNFPGGGATGGNFPGGGATGGNFPGGGATGGNFPGGGATGGNFPPNQGN